MKAAEAPADPARPALAEAAPAKLNLTLHVTGRRADGYHELESLVAFTALGDRLSATPARSFSLEIAGPFAGGLDAGPANLVLRAATALARQRAPSDGRRGAGKESLPPGLALRLEKVLPVAAGIGGGSADAAAALRLAARLWQVPVPPDLAAGLGADVPVCLSAPRPQLMRGIGERVAPAPPLPEAWVVLVNPRVALPTAQVFAALERPGGPGPDVPRGWPDFAALRAWLRAGRNDLEAPSRSLCPAIGAVLEALAPAPVARMSGSGATCFALHPGEAAAQAQAAALRRAHPDWWVAVTPLAG